MKRAALLYSGEIRQLLDCFNNHYETFILQNPDYEVDIFAYFWIDAHESNKLRERVVKTLKAKKIVFESRRDFGDTTLIPDSRFPHPISNTLSMFYGMERVNKIKNDYAKNHQIKYDVVVRLRSDNLFLKWPDGIKGFDKYKLDRINVKDEWAHLEYGINDQFAFGPSDLMDKYMSVYSNIDKLQDLGAAINPECLLGYNVLKLHKLPVDKHKMNYWIYSHILWVLNKDKI